MLNIKLENSINTPEIFPIEYRFPIKNYSFYTSRQGYVDEKGRYEEIISILDLFIVTETEILGKRTVGFSIYFRTKGALRTKRYFDENRKMWVLEQKGNDVIIWMSALQMPSKHLDIKEFKEENLFLLYLYTKG